MQRKEDDGVIISCDFCGSDWDQIRPMIEGHRGSFAAPGVICLECLKLALTHMRQLEGDTFACTLCRHNDIATTAPAWVGPATTDPPPIACRDCVRQAARAFHRDEDVEFTWDELARKG